MGRLFWKIFIGFSFTLLITVGGVGGAIYLNDKSPSTEEGFLSDRRADFVVGITANALKYGSEDGAKALFDTWPGHKRPTVLIINDHDQDILGREVEPETLRRAINALTLDPPPTSVRKVKTETGNEYILFIPAGSADSAGPLKYSLELQIFIALLASLLFSAGFAVYLSRPIKLLRKASRKLAEGDLTTRVSPELENRNDELTELGQDFDYMATRLQTLLDAQRLLLHDVSHELRSPVARMRLAVGLAQQQPDKLASALSRIERETERLDELLGQMLTLSRLEAGIGSESSDNISLTDLLAEIVQDANFEAQAVGSSINFQASNEVLMQGHYELLRRAFENIIRNALKYNHPGESVEVSISKNDQHEILVEVRDHGPGLPEDEIRNVFQPFYRVPGADKPGNVGYGLGLAIAQRAIERHHGNIVLKNCQDGGLCVCTTFPSDIEAATTA
ncbi:HAMP domain-containing protein [Methylobacillus caricis]|uniref:ATP-binding protein n=1 Tax=Methylobacillus caricis TaxID=1971611 RepID=UPI001CFFE1DB|nr:ATP-binding protein [Methylobacillus caricis]MCB5186828.1 HAMP domain-containing protein [Methylobacillus caricis]